MTRKPRFVLLAAGLAALALSACNGAGTEAPVEANDINAYEVINETETPELNIVEAPTTNAASESLAMPGDEVPDEAQMQDDAEASGMTSRVNRDEAGSTGNEAGAEQ